MRNVLGRYSVQRWLRAITLRTFVLFALAIVASAAFVVIAAELRNPVLDRADVAIEMAAHRLDSPIGDATMKTATLVGSNVVLLPAVALVVLLAIRRRRRVAAVILVTNTVAVIALNNLLKHMFQRERPRLFDKISLPTDYSFPSGHSMSAMGIYGAMAAVLVLLYPHARRTVIVAACLLVGSIGFSRIYLGVHWPFDVLGGFLGGVPPLIVSVHLLHRGRAHDRTLADLTEHRGS